MRACIDTNILISFLLAPFSPSPPTAIIDRAFEGSFTLVIVETTLEELRDKVSNKPYLASRIAASEVNQFVDTLVEITEIVQMLPHALPKVVRDPRDDYLLAPAVLEQVDYVVTGDKDLLILGEVAGVRIVTPAEFVAILNAENANGSTTRGA